MSHSHHEHAHRHSHPHPHGEGDAPHLPRWRLLSLSAGQRLLLAALPLGALWLLVMWALQEVA